MTREEQEDAIKFFSEVAEREVNNAKYSKLAIEALEQKPCEDCISRQAIKRKLQEHHDFFIHAYGGFSNLSQNDKSRVDEITNCIAMVVNEPSVTPKEKTGWIPVSERLPENHKDVLICLSSDKICIGCYNSHRLSFSNNAIGWGASYVHNWCSNDVIVWMPLPEPYEPQESEREYDI